MVGGLPTSDRIVANVQIKFAHFFLISLTVGGSYGDGKEELTGEISVILLTIVFNP